jgi:hypothetical protein
MAITELFGDFLDVEVAEPQQVLGEVHAIVGAESFGRDDEAGLEKAADVVGGITTGHTEFGEMVDELAVGDDALAQGFGRVFELMQSSRT